MRILVTGAAGFVGRYAVQELLAAGHAVVGFDQSTAPHLPCPFTAGDVRDLALLRQTVRQTHPDAGIHLAALAFPPGADANPSLMAEINILGTVNLCEAFRQEVPNARLLVVSSARVYGSPTVSHPLPEETPLNPDSFYAVTKASADLLTLRYAQDWGCPFLVARPHNHTGPGQPEAYVVPSIIRQIQRATQTKANTVTLRVGNTASRRDFLDVRDVTRAYRLLLEHGVPGRPYNIASGRTLSIGELIETIARLAGVRPLFQPDSALLRPTDCSAPLDTSRIRHDTGWEPQIPLEQTLREMLAHRYT